MFKKVFITGILVLFTLGSICAAFATEGPAGNKRKGKYTYRKVYKSCNERGEVESAKPLLNPDAKTQAEWTGLFDKKDFKAFKCAEEWGQLDDKALLDIYTYLHAHASDSPTPAKCK